MLKRVSPYYAFGFFVSFASFVALIIFNIESEVFSSFVFLSLIGLTCSYPIVFFFSVLTAKKEFRVKETVFQYPTFSQQLTKVILLMIIAVVVSIGLGYFFYRAQYGKYRAEVGMTIPRFPQPTPTGDSRSPLTSVPAAKLEFNSAPFSLQGSLLFLRKESNSDDLDLLVYQNGKQQNYTLKREGDDEYQLTGEDELDLPRLFVDADHDQTLGLPPGTRENPSEKLVQNNWPFGRSFRGLWPDITGYVTGCQGINADHQVCYRYRSSDTLLENRMYDWDGIFYDQPQFAVEGRNDILSFDYAGLKIAWDDPDKHCGADCLFVKLVGYFDNYQKAFLELRTDRPASYQIGDGSGWMGFYIADLENKTMTPYQNIDFGLGKAAQKRPFVIASAQNLFIYFRNNQLVADNLLTNFTRLIKTYQEPIDEEWHPRRLKIVADQYLLMEGEETGTIGFFDYFDLNNFDRLDDNDLPIYLRHPDGYFSPDRNQYAWADYETVTVYDFKQAMSGEILNQEKAAYEDRYYFAGWGY